MTPKEKAEQLYNKMVVDFDIDYWQTKQCAIIAVDEIIDCTKLRIRITKFSKEYWEQVKKEIELL